MIGSHGEVAHRHQLAARRGGDAVHTGDHRLRQLGELHHELAAQAEQALLELELVIAAHLLEVVPGAKGLAFAGQHHHAHAVVGGDRVHRGDQGLEHFVGQGVELMRTVQRQRGDTTIVVAQEHGIGIGNGNGAHQGSPRQIRALVQLFFS